MTRARFASFAVGLAAMLFVLPSFAARPELSARVDATQVSVGDEVHLTLRAMSETGALSQPQPGNTRPGFSVIGESTAPSQSISIVNGRVSQKSGVTATWTLHADRAGTWTIGPASIMADGINYSTSAIRVVVVPPGRGPRRPPPPDPMAPFDPWKGLFDAFGETQGQDVPVDPKLSLDAARGDFAFLHATIDKTSAVVGEQVTLSIYIYVDTSAREPDLTDVHEATANDFLKRSLFEDDASSRPLGYGQAGGKLWAVKLVRKSALFSLKAGDLEIGPMSLSLVKAQRIPGSPERTTETLHVHVTEPPLDGRPPGYVVGDVGSFALAADVSPREIERDGALGVTVDLSGFGNLPSSMTPPPRAGIEWLAPEIHEKMGAQGDRFGGKRTFSFVVRAHKEGAIDLGDLTLPYWNPESRSYGVARAALGSIHVKPGATPASSADAPVDPLVGLPPPRAALAGTPPSASHATDSPLYWLGLLGAPLAFAAATGAREATRRMKRARAARVASPETELRERMDAAERAAANVAPSAAGAREADAAVVRALEAATIARAGVNVRDARGDEIARRLAGAGVSADLADRVATILRGCEAARFSPDAGDSSAARARWADAKRAIGMLRKA